MKLLVAACLVLCAGAVYSQLVEPFDRPYVNPFIPVNTENCRRRVWGWQSQNIGSYTNTTRNTVNYHFKCVLSKPRWSECKGGCNSYDRLGALIPPVTWRRNCRCCEAQRVQVVTPRAWCWYIWSVNNCNGDVTGPYSGWTDMPAHKYYLMDNCRCNTCTSGQGRKRRDLAGDITGLPEVETDDAGVEGRPDDSLNRQPLSPEEEDRYKDMVPNANNGLCLVPELPELPIEIPDRFIRRN